MLTVDKSLVIDKDVPVEVNDLNSKSTALFCANKPSPEPKLDAVLTSPPAAPPVTTFPSRSIPKLLIDVPEAKSFIFKNGTYTVSSVVPVMFCPPNTALLSPEANELVECMNEVLPDAIEPKPPACEKPATDVVSKPSA